MMKTFLKSLKTKFILFVVLCNIPPIILTSVILYYSALTLEQRTLEIREQSLTAGISNIDKLLEKAKTTLYINYNLNFIDKYATAASTRNDTYFFYRDMKQILDSYASANESVISFFNYTPEDDYLILDKSSSLLGNKDAFLAYINSLTFPSDNGQWATADLNDCSILIYPLSIGKNITGLYIRLDDLLQFAPAPTDAEGFYHMDKPDTVSPDFDSSLHATRSPDRTDRFFNIRRTSDYGYALYYIYPRQTFTEKATFLFYMIIGMMILTLLVLPCSILFISRFIFQPMNRLNYGLIRLQQDDYSYRMNEQLSSTEFNTLSHSFNTMSQRILDLKAEILQREEAKRRSELSWLKHQIHPHFLLNNINQIYTLAQDPFNENIQSLSLYLTDYMRYSLRTDQSAVPLSDEIRHLKDYLDILKINYPERIHYQIICDHALYACMVPTFILNTVLENSVNYGFSKETDDLDILILVSAVTEEHARYLDIRISDCGCGYPVNIIDHVNSFEDFDGYFSSHIGLRNIKYRLYLSYGEKNLLHISNRREGGALTEIKIPFR